MKKSDTTGVYAIFNNTNEKIYVGSSRKIQKRFAKEHLPLLNKGKHYNCHLQNAWNKYGEDTFDFRVIEECEEGQLVEREGHWIEHYKSWDRQFGYNLNRYVEGRAVPSEETKLKRAIAHWKHEIPYEEAREKTIELFKNGVSKNGIANQLGIDRMTVYSFLEKVGLHKNTGRGTVVKLTKDKKDLAVELINQGKNYDEIQEATEVSRTQLHRKLVNDDRVVDKANFNYWKVTPEVLDQAVSLRKTGLSWKEVGQQVGLTREAIYYHKLPQMPALKNKVRTSMTDELKQQIIELRQQGLTWKAISESTGVGISTFKLHGLHKR